MTKRILTLCLMISFAISAWADTTASLTTATTITFEGIDDGTFKDSSNNIEVSMTNYSYVYGKVDATSIDVATLSTSLSSTIGGFNFTATKSLSLKGTDATSYSNTTKRVAGSNLNNGTFAGSVAFNTGVPGKVYVYAKGTALHLAYEYKNGNNYTFNTTSFTGEAISSETPSEFSIDVIEGTMVLIRGNAELYAVRFVPEAVTAPTINNSDGTITITAGESNLTGDGNVTIKTYYTTDGSDPTASNTEYTGSFEVATSCTVKAISINTVTGTTSTITSEEVTIDEPAEQEASVSTEKTWTFNTLTENTVYNTITSVNDGYYLRTLVTGSDNPNRTFTVKSGSQSLSFVDGNNIQAEKYLEANGQLNTSKGTAPAAGNTAGDATKAGLPSFAFNASVAGTTFAKIKYTGSSTNSVKHRLYFVNADGTTAVTNVSVTPTSDIDEVRMSSSASGSFFLTDLSGSGKFEIYTVRFVPATTVKVPTGLTGGSVTADKASANADETVTLTITPADGYQLKAGTLKAKYINDSGVETEVAIDANNQFTKPAYYVYVTAEFEEAPAVTEISSVEITGLAAPVKGQALKTLEDLSPSTTGVSISSITWSPEATTAAASTAYIATIVMEASSGYQFASTVTANAVSEKNGTVTRTDDTHISVAYEFDATAADTPTETVSVFLTAGQSNTAGRCYTGYLPDYIKTLGAANLNESDSTYQYCQWSYTNGTTRKNESEGVFRKFWPEMESASNTGKRRFAYDAILYYWIEKALQTDFYVVKHAAGGTSIDPSCTSTNDYHWSADTDWLERHASCNTDGGTSMLKAFCDNIGASLDALTNAGKTPDIKAMIWHQGESDRSGDAPTNYKNNLKAVIEYVRDYLVDKTGDNKYATLDIIAGTVPSNSKQYNATVRQALTDLASEDSHFHVIETNPGTFIGDQLHFDTNCAERLGINMYNKLVNLGLVSGSTQEVPDAIIPEGQPVTLDFKTWAIDNIGTNKDVQKSLTLSDESIKALDGTTDLYKAIGSEAEGDFSEFAEAFALSANEVKMRGNVGLQLNTNQVVTFSILNLNPGDGVTITFGAGGSATTLSALSENIFVYGDDNQAVLEAGTALTSKTVTYVVKSGNQIDLTFGSTGGHYINSIVIEPGKVEISEEPTQITIHTIGDSTMSSYDQDVPAQKGMDGWGDYLQDCMIDGVTVYNWADRGETARSYFNGIWSSTSTDRPEFAEPIADKVHAGDYVIIQFGHNDSKAYSTVQYESWLGTLVDAVVAKGATPILAGSICRARFSNGQITRLGRIDTYEDSGRILEDGASIDDYTFDYPYHAQQVATTNGIQFIDVTTGVKNMFETYGEAKTKALFPSGEKTHTNKLGAQLIAKVAAKLLYDGNTALKDYVDVSKTTLPAAADIDVIIDDFGSEATVTKKTIWTFNNYNNEDVIAAAVATETETEKNVVELNGLYARSYTSRAITAVTSSVNSVTFSDNNETQVPVSIAALPSQNYDVTNVTTIGQNTAGRSASSGLAPTFALNIGTPGTFYCILAPKQNNDERNARIIFSGKEVVSVPVSTAWAATDHLCELKYHCETTGVIYISPGIAPYFYAMMFVPDIEAGTEEDWNYQMLKTRENGYWTYTNMSGGNQSVPEGLTAYAISEINSAGKAVLVDYGTVIPTGAAVLVKGEPNTEYAMLPTESAGTYSGTNLLKPNTELRYLPATESDKTNYYFDGTQFIKATGGETIHEKQAYLNVTSTAGNIALNIPETITSPTFTITGNSVAITNGASTEVGTIKSYYQIGTSNTAPAIGVGTWTEYTEAITMTATGYVYAYSKNMDTDVTSEVAVSPQVVLSAAVTYDFMAAYNGDNNPTISYGDAVANALHYYRQSDSSEKDAASYPVILASPFSPALEGRLSTNGTNITWAAKGLSVADNRAVAIHNLKVGDVIRIEYDGMLYYAKSNTKGGNALADMTTGDIIKGLKDYTVSSVDDNNNYVILHTVGATVISQISINEELTMKYVPKPTVSSNYTVNDNSYTYTINYLDGATLTYTLPGGTEQTASGTGSLNVDVTKIGDFTATASKNDQTSEALTQTLYAPTPAIASDGNYDFGLITESVLKDYRLGEHQYNGTIEVGGMTMKKPDVPVAKTLDRFAFNSDYLDGTTTKDGRRWYLLSAGRLRAFKANADKSFAILNLTKGQYLTLTYSGGAAVKYQAGGTATMAENTDTLFSGKSYEILTDGNLLLTIPANADSHCDITGISLASTETVTAPTIEARTEINKVTLRLGTSSFGKTVTAYYTLDGSTPTTSSTAVTKNGAITVDESCTMKAYCVSETGVASSVTEYTVSLPAASKSDSKVYDFLNVVQHGDEIVFATDGQTVYDKEYDATNGWVTKKRTDFNAATTFDNKVSVRSGASGVVYDTKNKTIRLTKPLAIHNLAVDDEIVIIYTGDGSLYSGAADEGDVFTVNGNAAPAGTVIKSGAKIKVTRQKYENNYVVVTPSGTGSGKVFISSIYINHAAPTVANTPKCELATVNLDKMESTYRFTFDEGAMLFYMNTADNETLAGSNTGTFDITVTESAKLKAWEVNGTLISDTLSVTVYAPTPAPSTTGNFDFTEASEDLPADIEVTLDASKSVTVGGETLYKPSALTAATFGDKFAFTGTNSSNKIRIRTNHQLVFAKGTNMSMGLLNLKKGDIIAFNYTGSITFADPSQVSVESPAVAARAMTRTVSSDMTSGTAYVVQADGNILLNLNLTEESTSISKMYIAAAPTAATPAAIDFATASENYEEVETGSSTSVYIYGKSSAQTFKRLVNSSDELPIDGMISTESGSGEITADGIKAANRHIAIHNLAAGDKITISFFGGALTYGGHETYGNRVSVDGKTLAAQDALTSGDVMVVEKVDYLNNYVVLKLDSKCCISGIFINRDEEEKVWAPTIVESGKNTVLITAGRSSLGYQVTTYYTTDGTDPSDRNGIGGPYESYDVELLDGALVPVKAISYSVSGKVSNITTFNIFADMRTDIIGVSVEDNKQQVVYDLQGRKVETPMEGRIYIIDGKKVLYRRK